MERIKVYSQPGAQAYGVASSIAHDPHLAEDIVQDALIRAFLKLGALSTLLPVFPFPQGGTPNDPNISKRAIAVLQTAKEAEARGVEALERLLAVLPK